MGFAKEFKEFAVKGNVIDLAVAVVLGGAFGAIITAFTEGLIMPLISMIVGKASFADMTTVINGTEFPYGRLLQAIIDFILIAFVLFLIIRGVNRMKRRKEAPVAAAPPEYTLQEKLLMEIRDSLRK
ncbi:MAG TPA: large conductance mechanosensitive channel protein MscL [Flavisolibacter sp.]